MTLEQYTQALKSCDWYFNYSDDFSVYSRGARAMDQLVAGRKEHDPDWALWNAAAPAEFRVNVEAKQ